MTELERRALERAWLADPSNDELAQRHFTARARLEGPEVYLECLNDRLRWQQCPSWLQDAAIETVLRLLGSDWSHEGTRVYSCGGQSHRIASLTYKPLEIITQLIPAGPFLMGSADGPETVDMPEDIAARAQPKHRVHIEQPFLLGRTPISYELWWGQAEGTANHLPASHVNRKELGRLKDWGDWRLPSESEWEYACRAGTDTAYFWGDELDPSYLWCAENAGNGQKCCSLHEQRANAFGLVDMLGNIWEWCEDDYIEGYESGPINQEPRRKDKTTLWVQRGGGWASQPYHCRSATRDYGWNEGTFYGLGLRVAKSLPVSVPVSA